jgi:tripartite-type tricarboxylate transporter receptor subunit TctC
MKAKKSGVSVNTLIAVRAMLVVTLVIGSQMSALAQGSYPTKPIKIVVPFSAGSAVDILPRLIAEKLSVRWGQPVVVENRPGASGNIGAEAVAHAPPDGHTLLSSPAPPLVINQFLYPKLPFDPAAFVPVTVLATAPNVLVVSAKLPANNLDELIAFARANPQKLSYASPGNATTPHLTAEWFSVLTGIRTVHVAYKGATLALTDVMAGQVDMMFGNLGDVLPHVRSGKLKLLGVASEQRVAAMPEVPALAERFPGFISIAWYAIVAPPNTSSTIANQLATAIAEVLKQPDAVARLNDLNATAVAGTPAQTAEFMAQEAQRWRKVIALTGVTLQ